MRLTIVVKLMIYFILANFTVNRYAMGSNDVDNLISLNFHQAPTSIILQTLADYRQFNLILDGELDLLQTVKLTNIDWYKALTIITDNAKLQYIIDNNILIITAKADPKLLLDQQRKAQIEQELSLPLVYFTLKVDHTDLKALQTVILEQKLLSERGKVFIDDRTNTLVIYDIKKNIDNVVTLIKQLDKPIAQVHISAKIVTMSNEGLSELGIKWGYTGSSSQLINQFDINIGLANKAATLGFNLAKRSNHLLNLELSALEAENQLEIIASPTLLTANKQMASIKQGTEIPYEVSSGSNGATSIEFKQAVLGLEVTPRVLSGDQIELTLYITQNTAGRSIKRSDGGEALAIDTQEIRTQVLVNNGETLVLGGIFQQSRHQETRAVPGVNRLPIIGGLFKYQSKKQQKRELIIFITPQLISF
ncbi:type IV pilus secretin PilQ [Orbus wheelerorum]|uniref:type IV pilus secretin PilQ n=1 Tax=Orbus wheelerorum TaxID=3074111 RepID=UPI00370D8893